MIKVKTENILDWKSRRFGQVVHRVMQLWIPGTISDISKAVDFAVTEMIEKEKRKVWFDEMKRFVESISSSPEINTLKGWLEGSNVYTEIPILGKDGQRYRLDLLISSENLLRVVDYKVSSPSDEYVRQIKNYCQILSKLGKEIEGYLMYLWDGGVRLDRVV